MCLEDMRRHESYVGQWTQPEKGWMHRVEKQKHENTRNRICSKVMNTLVSSVSSEGSPSAGVSRGFGHHGFCRRRPIESWERHVNPSFPIGEDICQKMNLISEASCTLWKDGNVFTRRVVCFHSTTDKQTNTPGISSQDWWCPRTTGAPPTQPGRIFI